MAEQKQLHEDDLTFINGLLAESHQDVTFHDFISFYGADRRWKERLLVISRFRIFTIKSTLLGRSVRQNYNILDLESLSATEGDQKLAIKFKSDNATLQFEHKDVDEIARQILFAYQAVSYGRPSSEMAIINLPETWMEKFLPPEADAEDGLLACYLASCDRQGLPSRPVALDYMMTCLQLQDHALELADCLCFLDGDKASKDVTALIDALRYSELFTEMSGHNFKLGGEGLSALAPILEIETKITKLSLVNCQIKGRAHIERFGRALSLGHNSLNFLNLSKNPLGDNGIKILASGLDQSQLVLSTLCLRDCNFTSAGFKSLASLISSPGWLENLKILDLSDNQCGKSGNGALAEWLSSPNLQLEQLFLVHAHIDLEVLLKPLSLTTRSPNSLLHTLNISGNKITKKALPLLTAVLRDSLSLAHVYLSNTNMSAAGFSSLVDAALSNENKVQFSLDFSQNNLGVKGTKDLLSLMERWKQNDQNLTNSSLHTLILSNNGLNTEAISNVCRALSGISISTLALDCNLKIGIFNDCQDAGEEIARFMNSTPCLRELRLAGDDGSHALKTVCHHIFMALPENKSLHHLDVSGNRIGDEGLMLLAENLEKNDTLKSFHIDNNRLGLQGFKALRSAAQKNTTLTDYIIPMDDVVKLHKTIRNDAELTELRNLVEDLEVFMERNETKIRERDADVKVGDVMNVEELDELLSATPYGTMRPRMSTIQDTSGEFSHLKTSKAKYNRLASRTLDNIFYKQKKSVDASTLGGLEDIDEKAAPADDSSDESDAETY